MAGKGGESEEDLLLSEDLMRVAEEDKRLLMVASGCFRFVADGKRLSAGMEGRQTREVGFTLDAKQERRNFGCKQSSTRLIEWISASASFLALA